MIRIFNERRAEKQYQEALARPQVDLAATTPEELIEKIRRAIEYLASEFWPGDKPRWVKIFMNLGQFAGLVWQVLRAVLEVLKK